MSSMSFYNPTIFNKMRKYYLIFDDDLNVAFFSSVFLNIATGPPRGPTSFYLSRKQKKEKCKNTEN